MARKPRSQEELLSRQPPACTCQVCSDNCCLPCWGTPADIRKLIDAGYGDRLALEIWRSKPLLEFLTPALKGSEGKRAAMRQWSREGCTFWIDRLCAVHDEGLKPTEGRMTHHHPMYKIKYNIREWIAEQWDTDEARELVRAWKTEHGIEQGA